MSEAAPFGTLVCDDYGSRCDCCDRFVCRTRRSLWHGPHAVCFACFSVWYDSDWDTTEDIKRMVLKAEQTGTSPFPCAAQGGERVPD